MCACACVCGRGEGTAKKIISAYSIEFFTEFKYILLKKIDKTGGGGV